MAFTGGQITYPTVQQICRVNREIIEWSGGSFEPPDNLINPGSLDTILQVVQFPILGELQYPTLKEKAAALGERIIVGHVFNDGNKRTVILVAWGFLYKHQTPVILDSTVEELAVDMASQSAGYAEFLAWLHAHQ